jgi:ATP-binding protein involved in chromosome partitioning
MVAVGSGKGGVGKSTVTVQLALALARRGLRIAILDADFYGPNIPLLFGVSREERARQWNLWTRDAASLTPIEREGIALMSVGLLVGEGQALTMGAPLLQPALTQLLHDVDWGDRDVLLLDLPPGTSDLQQQLLALATLDGAVVVVGPQDLAHLDGRKFVDFLRDANVRILGGIENMSGLVCPHCGEAVELYPRVPDERSVWALGVPVLGRVPFEPALASVPAVASTAFEAIGDRLAAVLDERDAA